MQIKSPVIRKGEGGKKVSLTANYVRLEVEKGKGVFEYEVRFSPPVDSKNERFKCLNQHRNIIGPTKTFDGVVLFIPFQLPDHKTQLQSEHPNDGSPVTVTITLKHHKRMGDRDCIQLYNVLFNRIMNSLKMCMMNRNFYDPRNGHMIPQHKLEVWPGYVTAVQEFEDGIMLNCDVSHRVLRTQTVRDHLVDIHKMGKDNFNANAQKALIGSIVLTRYNNRCYKVDDIDFDSTPSSTFTDYTGKETSFVEYYKRQYNIDIKDLKQPMLLHREKKKAQEEQGVTKLICLVPELTFMTGLTDSMKADFRVMKDVAMYTRVTPNQRQLSLKKFIQNVNSSEEASAHLKGWGLKLSPTPIKLEGRVLEAETLHLGKGFKFRVGAKADWGKESTSHNCLTCVDITNWLVVFVQKNEKEANNFVGLMRKLGPKMGIQVAAPQLGKLVNDRTETYLKMIRDSVNPQVQLVVAIMPTPRDDRYAAVKKLCCVEKPVASQVINYKTIANEKKVSSVVQKVALQINCKLGGELWACSTPFKNMMVVGVDVYHDPTRKTNSIAGVVCSLNHTFSRWHSSTCFQLPGQELVDALKIAFIKGLKKYYETNHSWPDTVIIFRDGVGDGQLDVTSKHEVLQLKDCFKHISDDYSPGLGFVVVQKRINTRIFLQQSKDCENPAPGTVLDHTVTKRDWYDFFLVSQHVGQGTVSPSHYIVLHDSSGLSPGDMQKLAYKLTHMYYNWPGTVRVPAPCQYAHKLAYQVGEHIKKEPSSRLEERLFYL